MTKIQIVSDLHLEFSDVTIENAQNTDVLILSGDILIAQDLHDHPATDVSIPNTDLGRRQIRVRRFRDFMKRCSDSFPHVLYVAGNHEFYHGKWIDSIKHLREECATYPNVHFLECDTIKLGNVTFVGGTLWTDMNKGNPVTKSIVEDGMNDYRVIRNDAHSYRKLIPMDTIIRHNDTLLYIDKMVAEVRERKDPNERLVVVGHHAPTFKSVHPNFVSDIHMNGGYCSDLGEFILDRPEIVLWTHGHVHNAFDYMVGTCRVVCNPRGYQSPGYSENTGWDPNHVVEL